MTLPLRHKLVAIDSKGIEVRVGARVVDLTGVSLHGSQGREQSEEVQVILLRSLIQRQYAGDLWRQDRRDLDGSFLQQR